MNPADFAPWIPWVGAILGGSGITALISALLTRRTAKQETVAKQTQALFDAMAKQRADDQTEKIEDRKHRAEMSAKLDIALARLANEQIYSTLLLQWGLAGAPPPPPTRPALPPSN